MKKRELHFLALAAVLMLTFASITPASATSNRDTKTDTTQNESSAQDKTDGHEDKEDCPEKDKQQDNENEESDGAGGGDQKDDEQKDEDEKVESEQKDKDETKDIEQDEQTSQKDDENGRGGGEEEGKVLGDESPETIPETGVGTALSALAGSGALGYAAVSYLRSRKNLKNIVKE